MQRVAFEARVPDYGVPDRWDLFRRFQTFQIVKRCHRLCESSRNSESQVCRFQHTKCREEVGNMNCQTALQTSFSKRSVNKTLQVGLQFY